MRVVAFAVAFVFGGALSHAEESCAGDNARWVNPHIGTGLSDVRTLWGDYGGTYPGAVSPWGMLHISPETSARPSQVGYYYHDNKILYFSCVGHCSGYPNGSAGFVKIALLRGAHTSLPTDYSGREFHHADEVCQPGYYSVRFADGDEAEMTAASHAGFLRYSTSTDTTTVMIADAGHVEVKGGVVQCAYRHALITFSQPLDKYVMHGDTLFVQMPTKDTLQIAVSVSDTGFAESCANGEKQLCGGDFASVRRAAYEAWKHELACVDIKSADSNLLTVFYTALYHAMLLPENVADVGEKSRYGQFSFWDTFRTLHPLITLLKPETEKDMVDGMMDEYHSFGTLINGPMTGIHGIPVLLDSYVKGAVRCSLEEIYDACSHTYEKMSGGTRMEEYLRQGYVSARHEASVTVTAELAYDDWAMMRICQMAGHDDEAHQHAERALNYANLWDAESGFLLPCLDGELLADAGELGYQESTKYTATLFAPHNNVHLVNLRGGGKPFAERLAEEFASGNIVFDNECVLHYPQLFVWARRPDLAMREMRSIARTHFPNTPGGIPGNDDLGSMSSWLAFAVMGLMPACPGTDQYLVLPPMADEVTLHLPGGSDFTITGGGAKTYDAMPQPVLSDVPINRTHITHDELTAGGKLHFSATDTLDVATMQLPYSLVSEPAHLVVKPTAKAPARVLPDEECALPIKVSNSGTDGVCIASLLCDGQEVASTRVRVGSGCEVTDTIRYRLYAEGKHILSIGDWQQKVRVGESPAKTRRLHCLDIETVPVVKVGKTVQAKVTLKNISGKAFSGNVIMRADGEKCYEAEVQLAAGEEKEYGMTVPPLAEGMHRLHVADASAQVKVYTDAEDAVVLDACFADGQVSDRSGFGNDGTCHGALTWRGDTLITGKFAYVEFPKSKSLMYDYERFTMLTWIRPLEKPWGHVDFFTRGDCTALKMQGGSRTVTFFAGGWGRGQCEVNVPDSWFGTWHLLAGVCEPGVIKLYIDGHLVQTLKVNGEPSASALPWNLGRNAEMPFARFGNNAYWGTRIYGDALGDEQIRAIYERDLP